MNVLIMMLKNVLENTYHKENIDQIERLKMELAALNNAYLEIVDECTGYKRCLGMGHKD